MTAPWLDSFCNVLSVTVVGLCLVAKLPQIYNVLRANSTQGISLKALMLEYWCFCVLLAYPYSKGYPLSTFFEFVLLVVQDTILLYLVLRDHKLINLQSAGLYGLLVAFFYSVAQNFMPDWLTYILATTVTPLSATSKFMQLMTIFKNKDAGQVSTLTWAIASYTATARCFTILIQTGDVPMLVVSAMASVLNTSLFLSTLYFRKPKTTKTE